MSETTVTKLASEQHFLLLTIAEEWYAVALNQVRGVVTTGQITPVPGAPAHIVGVQNLQGRLLAVLDTAPLLGLDAQQQAGHIVVVSHDRVELGCLVRRAEDIININPDVLEEPLQTIEAQRRFLTAQLRLDDHLVGVLDVGALIKESIHI
jgi:purine-binding chemotaxis protein CheW